MVTGRAMRKLRSISASGTLLDMSTPLRMPIWILVLVSGIIFGAGDVEGRLYIDITAPSMRKIPVAIPDLKYVGPGDEQPGLGSELSGIISNDLDLSGYFQPLDKASFIERPGSGMTRETIHFKDWSVIGAELLLKGGYEFIGNQLRVEVRLFDVFSGKQLYGKRALGSVDASRYLMHRFGNEIIQALSGHPGPFLTRMAFVGTSTGHKEIYIADYDGHNLKQVTSYDTITLSPRWSPSGERMIYTSFRNSATMLFMHDMIEGSSRKISDRKGLNIAAAWKDEEEIALTLTISGNPDIYLIDTEGGILKRLTSHWGIDVSPAFSPDGKKMAFVSNRSGSPQIYVLDLVSNQVERLTFQGNYNTSPAWSKLDRIAFAGASDNRLDIYTISPDGRDLRRITQDQGNNENPCWSPDGRYIAFSSDRNGGRHHIFIANANGENQRQVTFFEGDQLSPSWAGYSR